MFKKKKGNDKMLRKYLDISTAHLTKNTFDKLNEKSSPYSFHYDEGVFISIPENDDPETFAKFPKDLKILLKYAWKNDAALIRLDADAEVDDALPVYEW